MKELTRLVRENDIEWNWFEGKGCEPGLLAWIPYSLMGQFVEVPEVKAALFDLGTIEAEFSTDSLCVDLTLFYDVSQLREAFPQSYFQDKSKGELLTIMDDYDAYLRAFKKLREPDKAPMELREFYQHGCLDPRLRFSQTGQEPGGAQPGLTM